MVKLKRSQGLVRYDSANGFAGKPTRLIRPRTIVYTALLLLGATVGTLCVSTFKQATVAVIRMTGSPYILTDDGLVRNQYLVRVINKQNKPEVFQVRVHGTAKDLQSSGAEQLIPIDAMGEQLRPLVISLPRSQYHSEMMATVEVTSSDGHFHADTQVPLLGPVSP
jgi:polyferredoxin